MKKIDGNTEIVKFDGVTMATVYKGSFSCLKKAKLQWKIDKELEATTGFGEYLTLNEITEQCKSIMITVFINSPLGGEIYQYGNYGDSWWKIGDLDGYA